MMNTFILKIIKGKIEAKKIGLFSIFCMLVLVSRGQVVSWDNLLSMVNMAKPKLIVYITKKGFAYAGKDEIKDTVLNRYNYIKPQNKKNKIIDSTIRVLFTGEIKETALISYQTTSYAEFDELLTAMKKDGFYCNTPAASLQTDPVLFQHNDLTVRTFFSVTDSIKNYALQVQKKILPNPKDVNFGDDLLAFNSHEYLSYYFGKNNVKNDIYFLSENEVARCSVLFLNTNRQVVYIWKDDVNKCTIDHLLFGGQQKLESLKQNDNFIAENNWILKSGIHAGMSLFELRRLNENDFKFYGGNAANSGLVLQHNTGKLDFKKENIILGCMNCNDKNFSSAAIINADDAIADEKILFVLTIALNP